MTALKSVSTTCLKELFEQCNWQGATKVCLATIAVFILIEAFPVSIAGIGTLPNLCATAAVFLFPCSLTLLPFSNPQKADISVKESLSSTTVEQQLNNVIGTPNNPELLSPPSPTDSTSIEEPKTPERPISNVFSSANLVAAGHLAEGPTLLPPSVLVKNYSLPPLSEDCFWQEEGYNIPSCPASARAVLDIGPFPPNIHEDISSIFSFIRNPGPSGIKKRNNPNAQWDKEGQLIKLKCSILRILRFGTVKQQKTVYKLFTHLIAPRNGISEKRLLENGLLIGKTASPKAFQAQLDKSALIPGQVVGLLSRGKKEAPPAFALFLRHHKEGFVCIKNIGLRKRLVRHYVKYEQACTFLEENNEMAIDKQELLDKKVKKKLPKEFETNKQANEQIEELRKLMQTTPPLIITEIDSFLIHHPFYIMWVIPPDQYKENMVLGRDITEAVVIREKDAEALRAWCREKKIQNMTVFVEKNISIEENIMATMGRDN